MSNTPKRKKNKVLKIVKKNHIWVTIALCIVIAIVSDFFIGIITFTVGKYAFEAKMGELNVSKIDGKRDFSYDSLSKAANDVPKLATCKPDSWYTMKDISDHYKQQFVVADFLMLKLGIKS